MQKASKRGRGRNLKLLDHEVQVHGLGDDFEVVDEAKLFGFNFIDEWGAAAILDQRLQSLLGSARDSIIHFRKRRRGHAKT